MDIINEQSTYIATPAFTDDQGNSVTAVSTPNFLVSVSYRLDDMGPNATAIIPLTSYPLSGPTINIEITPTQNALLYAGAYNIEYRRLTVIFSYNVNGDIREGNSQLIYGVRPMPAIM
jgi:hypothetical protein